mgnify:CR=1 FL=1
MHPFFGLWIGKVEPDLQKIEFQHPQERVGSTGRTVLFRLAGFDQRQQGVPGDERIYGL